MARRLRYATGDCSGGVTAQPSSCRDSELDRFGSHFVRLDDWSVFAPARRRLRARDPRDEDAPQVPAAAAGRLTMANKTHGKTKSGLPITEEFVAELAGKAEAGYNVDEMMRRRGGR